MYISGVHKWQLHSYVYTCFGIILSQEKLDHFSIDEISIIS